MANVDIRIRMREKDKTIQALRLKTEALQLQNAQLGRKFPKGGDARKSYTGPVTLESIYNWIDDKVLGTDVQNAQEKRKTVGGPTERAQRQTEWVLKRNLRPHTVVEPFSFRSYMSKNEVAPRLPNQGSLRLSNQVVFRSRARQTAPPRPSSAPNEKPHRPQRSHSARATRPARPPKTSREMDARNATMNSAPAQNRLLTRQSAGAGARRSVSPAERPSGGNSGANPTSAVESTEACVSPAAGPTTQTFGDAVRTSQGAPRSHSARSSQDSADRRLTDIRTNHSRRTAQKKTPLILEPWGRFKDIESGYAHARVSAPARVQPDAGVATKKSKTVGTMGPMLQSPLDQYNLIRRGLITLSPSKTMAQLSNALRLAGREQTRPIMDVRQGGQPNRAKLAWNSEDVTFEAVKTCAGHGSKCAMLPPIMERHAWIVPPERIRCMTPGNYTLSDPFALSGCVNLQLALYFHGTHFGVMLHRNPLRVPPFRFVLTVGAASSNVMAPSAQFIGPFGRVGDIWIAGGKKAFRMDEVEFPLRIMVDVLMTYAQQSAYARAHPPAPLHAMRTTDCSMANRDSLPLSTVPTPIVPVDTLRKRVKTAAQHPAELHAPPPPAHPGPEEIPEKPSRGDTTAQPIELPSPPPTPAESASGEIPENPSQAETQVGARVESPPIATVPPCPESVAPPADAPSSTSSALVGRMWVRIISATDLRAADVLGESDPYVVAKMRTDATGIVARKRTRVQRRVRHALWNEILDDFDINLPTRPTVDDDETIDLEVVDSDRISRDDPIGTASVPFATVSGERHLVCAQLWDPKRRAGDTPAVLLLEYCFLGADCDIRNTTAPTTITRIPQDVKLPRIGHVIVKCLSAVGLRNADYSFLGNDVSDPYCDVSVAGAFGNRSLRTKVIPGVLNPVWNEALEFYVTQMDTEISRQRKHGWGIKVEVMDSDPGPNPDDFLGLLELPDVYADMCAQFDKPMPEARHYNTLTHVALQDRQGAKKKTTGHLNLEVIFAPLSLPQYMRMERDPKSDKTLCVVDVGKVHAVDAAQSDGSRPSTEVDK